MAALNKAAERQYAWSRREEQLRELQELQEKVYEQAAVVRHSMTPDTAQKTDPNLANSISAYFRAGQKTTVTPAKHEAGAQPTLPPTATLKIKATHKTYTSSVSPQRNVRRGNFAATKAAENVDALRRAAENVDTARTQESSASARSMVMQVTRERAVEPKKKSLSRSRWWWRKWHTSSTVKDSYEVRICPLIHQL
jgi:hypothetical protein